MKDNGVWIYKIEKELCTVDCAMQEDVIKRMKEEIKDALEEMRELCCQGDCCAYDFEKEMKLVLSRRGIYGKEKSCAFIDREN